MRKTNIYRVLITLLTTLFSTLCVSFSHAQTPDSALTRLLKDYISDLKPTLDKEKAEIYLYVKSLDHAAPVFSLGADSMIHMASVQKLFITYVSLKNLGSEYRFPTEFFTDFLPRDRDPRIDIAGGLEARIKVPDNSLGNLYVRAYGDPLMQYEHMQLIARELKARGLNGVQDLVVDDTLFLEPSTPSGEDPYQAAQSATSLEFNCYRIQVSPSASGLSPIIQGGPGLFGKIENKAKTLSGKGSSLAVTQSPSNDLFPRIVKSGVVKPTPLQLVVDGRIGINDPLWEKYHTHPEPFLYYILSLKKALEQEGLRINGLLRRGTIPANSNLFYTFESEPLYSILARLNRVSSNFIAGQLLYAIGQNKNGIFSQVSGLTNLSEEIKNVAGSESDGMKLFDASGLSPENRISPVLVSRILEASYKDPGIFPVFASSLSRFGQSGTLVSRDLLDEKRFPSVKTSIFLDQKSRSEGVWAKTGTVDGLSGVAGYLDRDQGFKMTFVIVIKGMPEKSRAVAIEDDIVRILLGIN
ncbi:MAG TPA: D-alanyl-D-alanine carboxypeptidase/D-alanyl-D-alanine-endopeptidase [Oligoflexia bacterium]|nr:D-alanyl-D-alanine carboxypeptidase/D-alanyl-D-alanine-endopeptidase [Oligoflexia bacterium]HMP48084.1 D-alanyl-D-alanine carboxypeptidase/D-alanyl-D-alanine-endopeptidase [Oligoflexia bacterium]